MPKFRKKPVVIEAVFFDGTHESVLEISKWTGSFILNPPPRSPGPHTIEISTPEGIMTAKAGDWIIKGVQGEFYPCKDSIFRATYEPVEA